MRPEYHPTREAAEDSLSSWARTGINTWDYHGLLAAHVELMEGCEQACRVSFTRIQVATADMQDAMAVAEERAHDLARGGK